MLKTRRVLQISTELPDAEADELRTFGKTDMSILRLGIYRLPAAEVAVIRTIVRLSANDDAFRWRLVDAPPYDALLVDGTATQAERPELARIAGSVLALTRMNSRDLPNTLVRPIRADKLQQWLTRTECALRQMHLSELHMDDQATRKSKSPVQSASCFDVGLRPCCCAMILTRCAWRPCCRGRH